MTREMKVSLLVGLAFVIVIGILFSDHVAVDREKPTARIERVVANSNKAMQVPGGANPTGNGNIENPITAPDQVNPQGPVVRAEDLKNGVALAGTTANTGSSDIDITPIPAPAAPQIEVGIYPANPVSAGQVPGGMVGSTPLAAIHVPTADVDGVTAKISDSSVQKEPQILNLSKVTRGQTAKVGTVPVAAAGQKSYTAVSGDSLYKMVAKVYGKYSRSAEKAVLAANPDLAANPKAVKLGKVYTFPDLSTPAVASGNSAVEAATPQPTQPATPMVADGSIPPDVKAPIAGNKADVGKEKVAKTDKPAGRTTVYTVKDGDSLWKIAKAQLGSAGPSTIDTITKLNGDVLKSKGLHPGMTLKLPAREAIAGVD